MVIVSNGLHCWGVRYHLRGFGRSHDLEGWGIVQAQSITETTVVTIALVCLVAAFHWLSDTSRDGRPNWRLIVDRYFVVTSSPARSVELESDVDEPFDEDEEEDVDGVAMPDNKGNEVLSIVEQAKIAAIAALIVESKRKSFQNGTVPEVRAITTVFGVTVSSKQESDYQRLRSMLKAELAKREQPARAKFPELSEEQQAIRRELGLEVAE